MQIFEDIKNIKASRTELVKFGFVLAVFCGAVGGYLWWKANPAFMYLAGAAVFFVVSALFLPVMLGPLYKVWMAAAMIMGRVVSGIILVVLFYLVVSPIGLILRLLDRDLLEKKWPGTKSSYWKYHGKEEFDKSRYEKQY